MQEVKKLLTVLIITAITTADTLETLCQSIEQFEIPSNSEYFGYNSLNERFQWASKNNDILGQGSFGEVIKAKHYNKDIVIKKVKFDKNRKDFLTAEISVLKDLQKEILKKKIDLWSFILVF